MVPVAEMTLSVEGEERSVKSTGDGAVDAIFKSIHELYPHAATLCCFFQINAQNHGRHGRAGHRQRAA